jgi:hypothetical protein
MTQLPLPVQHEAGDLHASPVSAHTHVFDVQIPVQQSLFCPQICCCLRQHVLLAEHPDVIVPPSPPPPLQQSESWPHAPPVAPHAHTPLLQRPLPQSAFPPHGPFAAAGWHWPPEQTPVQHSSPVEHAAGTTAQHFDVAVRQTPERQLAAPPMHDDPDSMGAHAFCITPKRTPTFTEHCPEAQFVSCVQGVPVLALQSKCQEP